MARQPGKPPVIGDDSTDAALKYTSRELREMAREESRDFLLLRALHNAPKRVFDGLVVLADGSDWNPGSGAGYYGYYDGSWKKLG